MKRIVFLLITFVIVGCVYPTSQVGAVDDRPTLSIDGAPVDSMLLVDGIVVGKAADFVSGKQAVRLQAGTHVIRVEQSGKAIYEEKVFLSSGVSRSINIQQGK